MLALVISMTVDEPMSVLSVVDEGMEVSLGGTLEGEFSLTVELVGDELGISPFAELTGDVVGISLFVEPAGDEVGISLSVELAGDGDELGLEGVLEEVSLSALLVDDESGGRLDELLTRVEVSLSVELVDAGMEALEVASIDDVAGILGSVEETLELFDVLVESGSGELGGTLEDDGLVMLTVESGNKELIVLLVFAELGDKISFVFEKGELLLGMLVEDIAESLELLLLGLEMLLEDVGESLEMLLKLEKLLELDKSGTEVLNGELEGLEELDGGEGTGAELLDEIDESSLELLEDILEELEGGELGIELLEEELEEDVVDLGEEAPDEDDEDLEEVDSILDVEVEALLSVALV